MTDFGTKLAKVLGIAETLFTDASKATQVAQALAAAPSGTVIQTAVEHLGLANTIPGVKDWLAAQVNNAAVASDSAINPADQQGAQDKAQLFTVLHSLVSSVETLMGKNGTAQATANDAPPPDVAKLEQEAADAAAAAQATADKLAAAKAASAPAAHGFGA